MEKTEMFSVKSSILVIALVLLTGAGCTDNISEVPAWQLADGTAGNSVSAISIYQSDPDTVYAYGNGLLESSDAGYKWYSISKSSLETNIKLPLQVDPLNSKRLYASDVDGRITTVFSSDYYVTEMSTNRGKTWKILSAGPASAIRIDPVNPKSVFIAEESGDILHSVDQGQTWSTIQPPPSISEPELYTLAIDPSNDHILYAGYNDGIYKSTDQGKSWQKLNLGSTVNSPSLLAVDPQSPETVYAAVDSSTKSNYQGGVYKSTDGGKNWQKMDAGLSAQDRQIRSMTINPKNPDQLFLGLSGSQAPLCYESTNGGRLWSGFSEGLPDSGAVQSIEINTLNAKIYCGVSGSSADGVYIRGER
ncbi:MAG TPA: YCF48-related protein [Balneolales bacterium]|nr:YCF48-related protein [Balneolales bacterium]